MEERLKALWQTLWFKIVVIGVGWILLLIYGFFFTQQVVDFGDTRLLQHEIDGGYSYTGKDHGQPVRITSIGDDTTATVTFDLPGAFEESYDLTYVDEKLCILQENEVVFACTADLSEELWYYRVVFNPEFDEAQYDISVMDMMGITVGTANTVYTYTPSVSTIANFAFAPQVEMRGQPLLFLLLFLLIPIWVMDALDPTFFFRHRRDEWMTSGQTEPSDLYYVVRRFNLHYTYPLLCLGIFLFALFANP